MTMNFFRLLLQLILSPVQGWADIALAEVPTRRLLLHGLLPLLAVVALTSFLPGFYHPGQATWTALMQHAIVSFMKFFVSYFIAVFAFSWCLHRFSDAPSEYRSQTFAIFNLAMLSLIDLVENCLPIELTVVNFLAIYVAIVMLRGTHYLAVREASTSRFMVFAIATVIAPPYLLGVLLELIVR